MEYFNNSVKNGRVKENQSEQCSNYALKARSRLTTTHPGVPEAFAKAVEEKMSSDIVTWGLLADRNGILDCGNMN